MVTAVCVVGSSSSSSTSGEELVDGQVRRLRLLDVFLTLLSFLAISDYVCVCVCAASSQNRLPVRSCWDELSQQLYVLVGGLSERSSRDAQKVNEGVFYFDFYWYLCPNYCEFSTSQPLWGWYGRSPCGGVDTTANLLWSQIPLSSLKPCATKCSKTPQKARKKKSTARKCV